VEDEAAFAVGEERVVLIHSQSQLDDIFVGGASHLILRIREGGFGRFGEQRLVFIDNDPEK